MKRSLIFWIVFFVLTLFSCGGGGSSGDGADPEENKTPSASNLLISPSSPMTSDNLVASYDYDDPEGDSEGGSEIRWYNNGALQDGYNNKLTVQSSATQKGQGWYFTVRPKDGDDLGELVKSGSVTIQNSPPVADAGPNQVIFEGEGVVLNGSDSDDPDGKEDIDSYEWKQISGYGVSLGWANEDQATFTAPSAGPGGKKLEFELTIKDEESEASIDKCVVFVIKPVSLDKEKVEDILYTAYAGIGYMDKDDPDDDEVLYDVMFDDPNSLMGSIYQDVFVYVYAHPLQYLAEFNKLISGQPATLAFDHKDGSKVLYHAELDITPEDTGFDYYKFTATLYIDFKTEGYLHNGCTYSGDDGTDDLVADIIGYYDLSGPTEFWMFMLRSLRIEVFDSLEAFYPSENVTVTYDQWGISYDVYYGLDDPIDNRDELNLEILPVAAGLTYSPRDFRDYTLGGSFSIDGNVYTFGDGFHYVQQETLISIDGTLSIPGLNGSVAIDTPDDIIRSSEGIWTSGKMSITSEDSVDVEFHEDGSAVFTGDLGSWSVNNWQYALAPY